MMQIKHRDELCLWYSEELKQRLICQNLLMESEERLLWHEQLSWGWTTLENGAEMCLKRLAYVHNWIPIFEFLNCIMIRKLYIIGTNTFTTFPNLWGATTGQLTKHTQVWSAVKTGYRDTFGGFTPQSNPWCWVSRKKTFNPIFWVSWNWSPISKF